MRFSKTTDYALRVMVALATTQEDRLSLKKLAEREEIPRKFLEHIVRDLKGAGLIYSSPGPKGGYELCQPSYKITVAQIIQAVQGPLLPAGRLDLANEPDHLKEPIRRLRDVFSDIRQFARQKLESVSLADLVEVTELGATNEILMYYI